MAASNEWFVTPRADRTAKIRLFCFPFAGAGAAPYRAWPDGILPKVEIVAALLPGREARLGEPAAKRIGPVVEGLANAIRPHLDRPFAFFGHSMGAILAFELARLLRAEGKEPRAIFASGSGAPHLPLSRPHIHHLDEDGFREGLRRMNGVPDGVLDDAELFRVFAPTLRADLELCETYALVEGEPLTCPISAIGGLGDPDVSRDELDAWKQHTTGSFQVRMMPGDHFFIESARPQVLEAISRELYKIMR